MKRSVEGLICIEHWRASYGGIGEVTGHFLWQALEMLNDLRWRGHEEYIKRAAIARVVSELFYTARIRKEPKLSPLSNRSKYSNGTTSSTGLRWLCRHHEKLIYCISPRVATPLLRSFFDQKKDKRKA